MERNERVDAFRVLAIIAVIIIHTRPFEHQNLSLDEDFGVAAILNQASRFAVPFFFAMSGYFWGSKLTESSSALTQCLRPSRRILLTFFAWSIIYLAPTDPSAYQSTDLTGFIKGIYWRILSFTANPMALLLQGSKNHLWFLASLLCSLAITALLIRIELPRILAILSISLFITGLIGKAYADTSIGIKSDFNFRNGPFFSLIFLLQVTSSKEALEKLNTSRLACHSPCLAPAFILQRWLTYMKQPKHALGKTMSQAHIFLAWVSP